MLSKLDFISFRLANAYGPRNISGPLPTFYQRLTGGQAVLRHGYAARFHLRQRSHRCRGARLWTGQGRRGAYHVSSGRDFAIKELFDATVKALGLKLDKEVEVRQRNPDDVYTILLDPSETAKDFGWRTTVPLDPGVRAAIDWYRSHEITQTFTHLKGVEGKK